MPVLYKLIGAIVIGILAAHPLQEPKYYVQDSTAKIENAQAIANQLGKPIKVWMDGIGHVRIQPADQPPQTPFTILHSTWNPK